LAWLISILLAAIIAHSLIISAYRRKKEIATLLALGIRRTRVMMLISMEGMAITVFSLLVGICAGLVLALIKGLTFGNSGVLGLFLPSTIEALTILYTLAICVGITLLASLVPVIIISRMDPIKELRYE
ncbi:MAG: FtsX-like permease family protein, partial [Candidatus Thermoplasmatota archaeon]|nr:FtsX-like permease family protein [Candidatus Thermoplasmatota archaeon]